MQGFTYQSRKNGRFDEFKFDRKKIDLLLNLRMNGWSYNSLSYFFGTTRPAIRYQCEKYGVIITERGISIPFFFEEKSNMWVYKDGEVVNKGRTYKDYLKMEEERNRFPSNVR